MSLAKHCGYSDLGARGAAQHQQQHSQPGSQATAGCHLGSGHLAPLQPPHICCYGNKLQGLLCVPCDVMLSVVTWLLSISLNGCWTRGGGGGGCAARWGRLFWDCCLTDIPLSTRAERPAPVSGGPDACINNAICLTI